MNLVYFGEEAEQAIRDYIKSSNAAEKELIYIKRIQPVFAKLTENIINMPKFNFKRLDSYQTLHNEVMAHLYSNLEKFNPNRKSKKTKKRVKAFSYFGTVAKNYLVQKSIKRDRTVYFESSQDESISTIENSELVVSDSFEESYELKEFLEVLAQYFEENRAQYTDDKKKIVDAICYFLRNSQRENIYNKKHFYLLLREYTGLTSKQITTLLSEIKKEYIEVRAKYYEDLM